QQTFAALTGGNIDVVPEWSPLSRGRRAPACRPRRRAGICGYSGGLMRSDFAIDISRIRDEARQHLKQGPVTPSDTTDVDRVITVLNQVVASEMVCYLRYTQNAIVAQ